MHKFNKRKMFTGSIMGLYDNYIYINDKKKSGIIHNFTLLISQQKTLELAFSFSLP